MPKLSIIDDKMIIKDILNNISKNNKIPVSVQIGNKKESVELKFSEFSTDMKNQFSGSTNSRPYFYIYVLL